MQKREDRILRIRFNADTAASMTWNFKPQQSEIKVINFTSRTFLILKTIKQVAPHGRPQDKNYFYLKVVTVCLLFLSDNRLLRVKQL